MNVKNYTEVWKCCRLTRWNYEMKIHSLDSMTHSLQTWKSKMRVKLFSEWKKRSVETKWPLFPTFWKQESCISIWFALLNNLSCFMKLEQKAWGCPSFFFCPKWRGRRDRRCVWLWKQTFLLPSGALLQPWGALLRVPCRGNSILATVETIPCRLPFSSHMAHLCFCLTHKCTFHKHYQLRKDMWLASFTGSPEHSTPLIMMLL